MCAGERRKKGDAVSKHGDFKRCQTSGVGANRGGNFCRGTEGIARVIFRCVAAWRDDEDEGEDLVPVLGKRNVL